MLNEKINYETCTNQEQREALQAEIDAHLEESREHLTEDEKAKVDAIHKAMKIMTDAEVPFYMFCHHAMMDDVEPIIFNTMVQYNNHPHFENGADLHTATMRSMFYAMDNAIPKKFKSDFMTGIYTLHGAIMQRMNKISEEMENARPI